MARQNQWVRVSGWLFLIGVLIALVTGVAGDVIPSSGTILVVLGTLVGLLGAMGMGSINRDDTELFLLAVVALVAAGSSGAVLSGIPTVGGWLASIVDNIGVLVAPAAVIIAVEAIWRAGAGSVKML